VDDHLMPAYGESLVGIIDARIAAYAAKSAKMATVSSRDGTGTRATVTFDGSSGTPQPVKCFSSVRVKVGDRVGVIRYESEWIVTANYSETDRADAGARFGFSSTTTNASATFVDLPTSPTVTYTKARDTTLMEFEIGTSIYASVGVTVVALGLRVTGVETGIDYDQEIKVYSITPANSKVPAHGISRPFVFHPAGDYTATGRWRRTAGTGNLTVDVNDSGFIRCREVWST
jgi:hypothetical protein